MPSTNKLNLTKRALTLAITQKCCNLVLVDLTAKVSYGRVLCPKISSLARGSFYRLNPDGRSLFYLPFNTKS
jgi:hypothetical protein